MNILDMLQPDIIVIIWTYTGNNDARLFAVAMLFSYTSVLRCARILNHCFRKNTISHIDAVRVIKYISTERSRYNDASKRFIETLRNDKNNTKCLITDENIKKHRTLIQTNKSSIFHTKSIYIEHYETSKKYIKKSRIHKKCQKKKRQIRQTARYEKEIEHKNIVAHFCDEYYYPGLCDCCWSESNSHGIIKLWNH
jgi:hypothetical protein